MSFFGFNLHLVSDRLPSFFESGVFSGFNSSFLPFLGDTHTGCALFEALFVVISCRLGLELGFQVRFFPLIQVCVDNLT
ncbi:hypothetical protein V6N13_088346 [Hibiscus sabdariffa]|uniref:Uncharacterized protein n=1 Tax=Hibiscus sabdariffa TaxID=183260 RepID=A0ABR2FZ23_9ROSI